MTHMDLDGAMDAMDGAMDETMDAGMPVDLDGVDLFGDPLGLPTARAPSKQLLQRVDEMRCRGCCQKIAWSKQGTIATVSQDGRSIDLRYLRSHPENGSWGMSEPAAQSHLQFGSPSAATGSTQPAGSQIVHLEWSPTATPELAVIDNFGRVALLSCPHSLNKGVPARSWDADPVDDLSAVVGCYWLPLQLANKMPYIVLPGPAVREATGTTWKTEQTIIPANPGPSHPNPAKSVLLCVTSNGFIKIYWSQNNPRWQEKHLELESISSSDELITHASICSEKGGYIYIALALASGQLKIIKAALQLGNPAADKQTPPQSQPLNPLLKEKRVAYTGWLRTDASKRSLSILQVLPTVPMQREGNSHTWAPPLILAVRSLVSPYSHEVESVVDVWEILNDQPQDLHPAFLQLSSRNGVGSAPSLATRLKPLDPVVLHKLVLSIETMNSGRVICFYFSDGTVQYRDRFTLAEVYTTPDLDRFMTLNQMGFQYVEESPCLQIAVSPTNCSFAQISEDGKIKWNILRNLSQDIPNSALLAGLTMALSTATTTSINFDDILAIARQFAARPRFAYDWMQETIRILKVNVDYSEESSQDQLMRNINLQVVLSVLNHMGFDGEFKPRSFYGKFSMLTLNVRNIIILITLATNNQIVAKDQKFNPLDEPEVVETLSGCVKWALDMLSWLADGLLELQDDAHFMSLLTPAGLKDVNAYLQSKNQVALHLVLCSSTRLFLMTMCRRMSYIDSLSFRAIQYYDKQKGSMSLSPQNRLYLAYLKLQRHTSSSLIKVQDLERLLVTVSTEIRTTYQSAFTGMAQKQLQAQQNAANGTKQPPQQQQQQLEAQVKRIQGHYELLLLLGQPFSAPLLPMLQKLFGPELSHFKTQANPASLFFADYSLLEGVFDDARSYAKRKEKGLHSDVFRRVEIPIVPPGDEDGGKAATSLPPAGALPGAPPPAQSTSLQRRRCVRCASVMEEVTPQRPGINFVSSQQRRCSCGGHWGLLAIGSKVG